MSAAMPAVVGIATTRRRCCLLATMASVVLADLVTCPTSQRSVIIGLSGRLLMPASHSGLSFVADW